MNLIELDNCFAQAQAILTVSADEAFDLASYQAQFPADNDINKPGWGCISVINVFLLHQEKRTLMFSSAADRDARFAEIVKQMKNA